MAVIVFGSINMDIVARTPRLPEPGETITGRAFFTAPGGKGANQAVAAARLGVPTRMVGRVGGDTFGQELLQQLRQAGVDTTGVLTDPETSSGVAIIAVDDAAQNNIIIVPGANGRVDQTDVDRLAGFLPQAKILLLQLEAPLEASLAAARLARQHGLTVILDPAPARDLPAEAYTLANIITPNEVEAAQLVGFPIRTIADGHRAAAVLVERGVTTAVVKLGDRGAVFATREHADGIRYGLTPAFKVQAVDTVAAGDAFNGALAAALVEGHPLDTALQWAAAVGALSTTRAGAQPSMPTRAEFESFLKRQIGAK